MSRSVAFGLLVFCKWTIKFFEQQREKGPPGRKAHALDQPSFLVNLSASLSKKSSVLKKLPAGRLLP